MSVEKESGFHSNSREIPHRRVLIHDPSQLPHDYSTTPGGSIFSTTPGGTRIFYDRNFLLQCRNSPLAKSPPANMAKIPGITVPSLSDTPNGVSVVEEKQSKKTEHTDDQPQFQMDI